MMKQLITTIAVFLMFCTMAEAKNVTVDLAVDHVDITTGFNGSYLSLFGVHDQEGDIAVTIKGPRREMVVRRKENMFGVWMNRTTARFPNVPIYYDYALSSGEQEITTVETRHEKMIGPDTLRFSPKTKMKEEQLKLFQDALIRNKQKQGLFPSEPQPITYVEDGFFRTTFYIPSNVPTGQYIIETYLIRNGKIIDTHSTEVKVAQVGKSAAVNNFAYNWSFTYGFLCVMFAMGMGWFSNVIRRRLS